MARRVWIYWLLSVLLTATVGGLAHYSDIKRAQRQLGQALATQLAQSSAPWLLNRDMTSLNLLLSGLDERPGLARVAIIDDSGRTIAQTALNGIPGQRVSRPILLGQQRLGQLQLTLQAPHLAGWLQERAAPLAVMAALQLLCFVLAGRRPRQSRRPDVVPAAAMASPPAPDSSVLRPVAASLPQTGLLCVVADDPRHLLERISGPLQDELLGVMNQLLERVARLGSAELVRPMSVSEGALLRFADCSRGERAWQALAAAMLALLLGERAASARSSAGLLALGLKAGLHVGPEEARRGSELAALLAGAAPSGRLLVSGRPALPDAARRRAGWNRPVVLDVADLGQLDATLLEHLDHETMRLVTEQAERLVPLDLS